MRLHLCQSKTLDVSKLNSLGLTELSETFSPEEVKNKKLPGFVAETVSKKASTFLSQSSFLQSYFSGNA